jgi:hypothetical protein
MFRVPERPLSVSLRYENSIEALGPQPRKGLLRLLRGKTGERQYLVEDGSRHLCLSNNRGKSIPGKLEGHIVRIDAHFE